MANLKVPVTKRDHIQGSDKASITLVEYGDYECPYCGMAYPIIKRIQEHFNKELRFVFRNFPLTEEHPHAEIAAEAAEFAATEGKFWEMHDFIYENQNLITLPFLIELAKHMNLSGEGLELAIEKKTYFPKIQEDFLGGVHSGVNGTPTLFINDQRYDGNVDFADLVSTLNSLL
jgi:protein-disulfide isomerase